MTVQRSKINTQNLGVILIISMMVVGAGCVAKAPAEKQEIVQVAIGNILSAIPTSGTVIPRNRLEIKPLIAGRIEEIKVKEGEKVRKGEILLWLSSLERASLLDAARAQGPEQLKRWENAYRPTPIVAPIDGFIIQRNIETGQSVSASDAVLVMADKLIVKAQVDETDIGRIRVSQPATIILDAFPEKSVPAKVEHIAYESRVVSNVTVYEVNVLPNYVPPFFRSGMSASVNFSQSERNKVLLLPLKAVKKRGQRNYVLTIKNEKIEAKQIESGLEDSRNMEIVEGLTAGETVVVPNKELTEQFFGRRGGPFQVNPFKSNNNKGQGR